MKIKSNLKREGCLTSWLYVCTNISRNRLCSVNLKTLSESWDFQEHFKIFFSFLRQEMTKLWHLENFTKYKGCYEILYNQVCKMIKKLAFFHWFLMLNIKVVNTEIMLKNFLKVVMVTTFYDVHQEKFISCTKTKNNISKVWFNFNLNTIKPVSIYFE